MTIQTKTLNDADYRRQPKTSFFCCMCQKDMDETKPYRLLHLIDGGHIALHPSSEDEYVPDAGDCGAHPIGSDCARRFGLEWSSPPHS